MVDMLAAMRTLVLCVGIAVAGCGAGPATHGPASPPVRSEPPGSTVAPDDERVSVTMSGNPVDVVVPRVVLLYPGRGDRAPLRLQGGAPALVTDVTIVADMRGKDPAQAIAHATAAHLGVAMRSRRDGAVIEVDMKVLDATVEHHDDIDAGGALGRADRLADSSLFVLMTDRGQVVALGHKAADDAAAQVVVDAIAGALATPLPAEPIGVGARWRVRRVVSLSTFINVAALEETNFELKERSQETIRIDRVVTRVALFDGDRLLSSESKDRGAAKRAMTEVSQTPIETLTRDRDPIAHGRQVAGFAPGAPQLGEYRVLSAVEGDSRLVSAGASPPAGSALRLIATDQTTIVPRDPKRPPSP